MNLAMTMDDFTQIQGTGRAGIRSTRPAPGLHRSSRQPATLDGGPAVLDSAVTGWKAAYQAYGQASERSLHAPERDETAREMSVASWAVAAAWRRIAEVAQLPWWSLAAVETAAQAFEAQARDWGTRPRRTEPISEGPWQP